MATRTRPIATGSEECAAAAAVTLLSQGNAVDAVVAGVFAAAAVNPGVLLGPVQMLFGGAGLGLRAVDGRTRQPGKGAPRPRGFRAGDEIAPASRVGVPVLPAALAAALATSGDATLAQVLSPAIALAKDGRKEVLRRIAQRGPLALVDERVAGELVNSCGRIAGGLLTRDDLEAARPSIEPATELTVGARIAASVPWAAGNGGVSGTNVHVVAASDHRGLVAVACYLRSEEGVSIGPLDLVAPFTASPVLRGETRVKPGEAMPASAPIALARPADDGPYDIALGVAQDSAGESALEAVLAAWPAADALDARPPYVGHGALIALARTKDGAIILARR